jgi:sporulation related protein
VRSLIASALVLAFGAACSGGTHSDLPPSRIATAPAASPGPDALVLRVSRTGGVARVSAYPNVDSTVWTASDTAPALERVLGFDPDAGLLSAVDTRGQPLWIDLHVGSVTLASRNKLRDLSSIDGSTIFGVGADGAAVRFTPAGNWVFKPKLPTRVIFPQANGSVLVLGGRADSSRLWRILPPRTEPSDSLKLGKVTTGSGAPLGDQIYFVNGPRSLVGVHARTFQKGRTISFPKKIGPIAPTPSGNRFYVLTDSTHQVSVLDRYQDRVTTRIALPGRARDLRVDPVGRFLLVRSATGDSVWVIAIGTNQVIGTTHSTWRGDVPFVTPDGAIGVSRGDDIVFLDGSTLDEVRRVAGGASDFWYPFSWTGFRPRAAALDQPVRFPSDSDTTMVDSIPPTSAGSTAVQPVTPADSTATGFIVSFAALLSEDRAKTEATKIVIDGQTARVVPSEVDGTPVFRVVLGPYSTREEADRVGRQSGRSYYVYSGAP